MAFTNNVAVNDPEYVFWSMNLCISTVYIHGSWTDGQVGMSSGTWEEYEESSQEFGQENLYKNVFFPVPLRL